MCDAEKIETLGTTLETLLAKTRSGIFETRLKDAIACREKGNSLLLSSVEDQEKSAEQQRFQTATDVHRKRIELYERALYHVEFDEGVWHLELMDHHREQVEKIYIPLYLNLAQCYLLEEQSMTYDPRKASMYAKKALELDENNVKGLYRYGHAQMLMGNLDAAKDSLKKALTLKPKDPHIRRIYNQVVQEEQAHQAKQKRLYAGIFHSNDKEAFSSQQNGVEIERSSRSSKLVSYASILVLALSIGLAMLWKWMY